MDYQNNDFAINKISEGIVYRSVTGEIFVVTIDHFLSEDPKLTEVDFESFKEFSDEDYRIRCNSDHAEERRTLPYCDSVEIDEYADDSLEDKLIIKEQASQLYKAIENSLTETQKRRFKMSYFRGLTIRQIAKQENAYFTSVAESLNQAKNKIRKYLQII